jgi:hypothetical protein
MSVAEEFLSPTEKWNYTHFWVKEKDFAGAIPDLGAI